MEIVKAFPGEIPAEAVIESSGLANMEEIGKKVAGAGRRGEGTGK
jgi:hypothetical protein